MKSEIQYKRAFDPEYQGTPFDNSYYGPSKTVPDQNLTVKQLMERHTRGHGLGVGQREEHWFGDDDPPVQMQRMNDLSELTDRREALQEKARQLETKMRTEREQKKAEQQKQTQSVEPVKPRAAKEDEEASETQ